MLLSPSDLVSTSTNRRSFESQILIRGYYRSPGIRGLWRSDIRASQSHLLPVKEESCSSDGGLSWSLEGWTEKSRARGCFELRS